MIFTSNFPVVVQSEAIPFVGKHGALYLNKSDDSKTDETTKLADNHITAI